MKTKYDESLHKTFYLYLRALQQDVVSNSIEFLKKQWGKEWIKQKTNADVMLTPSASKRDTYDAKRKAGIDAIIIFDELMNEPQVPICINKPYELRISENIILTGVWEYIREVNLPDGSHEFQILKIRTENNKFQVNGQRFHDLELTAAEMAFNRTFNGHARLVYVDIYTKKMIPSYRDEHDKRDLVHSVKSVVLSLKHNIRCYSPDKRCYHCEYRNECLR